MGVLEQILEQNNQILNRISELESKLKQMDSDDTTMISSKDIIKDMGISTRTFQRMIPQMPFLKRFGRQYRARKCDYEAWKKKNL